MASCTVSRLGRALISGISAVKEEVDCLEEPMVASAVISMLVVGVGVGVVDDVVVRKEEGQKRVGCLPFANVQDVNWHSMILSLWRAGLMIVARPKTVPVVVAGSSSIDILRFLVLWSSRMEKYLLI